VAQQQSNPQQKQSFTEAASSEEAVAKDAYELVHIWIQAVALSTLLRLREFYLSLPVASVTRYGARQIVVDVDYFMNVLSALGITELDLDEDVSGQAIRMEMRRMKVVRFTLDFLSDEQATADALMKAFQHEFGSDQLRDRELVLQAMKLVKI
jgi:hypothetical protein